MKVEHKPVYTLTFEPTRADYRKFFYWASLKRTGQAITKALLLALVISLVAVILLQTPNILLFLLVYAAVLLLLKTEELRAALAMLRTKLRRG